MSKTLLKCHKYNRIYLSLQILQVYRLLKNQKKMINFAPGAHFGWLYRVDELRTSLEFIHISKYSIKGTRISKIFVLNDLSGSWSPTEEAKKLKKKLFFLIKFNFRGQIAEK